MILTKVAIISTSAIPSPPPGGQYSGVEAVSFNLVEGLTKLGNDLTLVTTNESPKLGVFQAKNTNNEVVGSLEVKGTGPTDWGPNGERQMFLNYASWLEKEFGDGQGVIIDMSWGGWPYVLMAGKLGLKPHPQMKVIHVCHAMANWFNPLEQKFVVPPVVYPRMIGVSASQAAYLSNQYGVPVRYVYNGISLPPKQDNPKTDPQYLLSLNRIGVEKGIHGCIDIALRTGWKMKVVGADSWVEQKYVADIVDKCHFSNGQIEYYGHVDNNTKWDLIANCKAGIFCPNQSRYVEAFGINAVEVNALGRPAVALRNGGHNDTITHGVNGFLANNTDEIVNIIKSNQLDSINPDNCRIAAERFSVENMARGYSELINGVMSDSNQFKW